MSFSVKPYLILILLQGCIFALIQAILDKFGDYNHILDYDLPKRIFMIIYLYLGASLTWITIGLLCFICCSFIYIQRNIYFNNSSKTIFSFIISIVSSIATVYLYVFGFFEWFCKWSIASEILHGMLISVVLGLCIYHYFINPETKI